MAIVIALIFVALAAVAFLLVPLPASDRALQLSLEYLPDKDAFVVRLRNQAPYRIRATVNATDYHGSIWVINSLNERKDYFTEQYLQILRTSITDAPVITMNRNSEVAWTIPRDILRGIHDEMLILDDLDGALIFAESGEIAPMPNGGDGLRSAATKCRTKRPS